MTSIAEALDQDDNELENAIEATPEGGKRSLRACVNAHCRDCIYDEHAKGAGNWRQQIAACTVTKCALYSIRPVSKPKPRKRLPESEE